MGRKKPSPSKGSGSDSDSSVGEKIIEIFDEISDALGLDNEGERLGDRLEKDTEKMMNDRKEEFGNYGKQLTIPSDISGALPGNENMLKFPSSPLRKGEGEAGGSDEGNGEGSGEGGDEKKGGSSGGDGGDDDDGSGGDDDDDKGGDGSGGGGNSWPWPFCLI